VIRSGEFPAIGDNEVGCRVMAEIVAWFRVNR